jgi:hypothetical protein
MTKAIQVWKDGREWWEVWSDVDGRVVEIVATREEATEYGAAAFVETPEPRFLVRDASGRGWCAEWHYSDIGPEERDYREESYDVDGNEEEAQTFGEWLDSSDAGDEFENSDSMITVIRIN